MGFHIHPGSMHTYDWEPLSYNLLRAVLDTAENAYSFQTVVSVLKWTFSMHIISQVQVRLQFTAAMPDQVGMVVTADVCCSCWFITVLPMQHRLHQHFQYHTIPSCNTMAFNGISNRPVCRVTTPENIQLNKRGKNSKSMLFPLISGCVTEYQIGMCKEYCTSWHFTPTESVWSKALRE